MSSPSGKQPHESVAILGWGSLIWNPPDSNLSEQDRLRMPGCWHSDGPMLLLEFSRVDDDGRLRLVVDTTHGKYCPVFYTLSGFTAVADAVKDLRTQEKLVADELVGVIRKGEATTDPVGARVAAWLEDHVFDAAIWPALGNNFQEKTGRPFTVENALRHLNRLPDDIHTAALADIAKVPESMDTILRQKARQRQTVIV